MFDIRAEIDLTIQGEEPKKIVVRFPTDAEFISWRRKKKVTQKDIGRKSFQIEPAKPSPADLAFVKALRADNKDGPELDEFEANHVLARITECEVLPDPEREGSAYVFQMKAMKRLRTSHKLRIPSVKEQMEYERMRTVVIFSQGMQEIRINFQAPLDLYDKLKLEATGYANDIPVSHKAEAVNALLLAITAEQEGAPELDDEDQD